MFSKYLKSSEFRSTLWYLFWFSILLVVPSLIYFQYLKPEFTEIFSDKTIDKKYVFLRSRYKFLEILPWFVVALTSVLVMTANTFIYFVTYIKEAIREKDDNVHKYYYWTLPLFIIWLLLTLAYIVFTMYEFIELKNDILSITKQVSTNVDNANLDLKLRGILETSLNNSVHYLELFIFITVILFIIIDAISIKMKAVQIKNVKGKQKISINNERTFVCNQLLIIDIPVLLGIILIYVFTFNLSETDIVDQNAKSVFTVGGVAMHIIMSQIIFLILAFQNSYREFQIKKTET